MTWHRMDDPDNPPPKAPEEGSSRAGPVVLLASDHGHKAVGYWGKGRDNAEGWINLHDHFRMNYWNAFTKWRPWPEDEE